MSLLISSGAWAGSRNAAHDVELADLQADGIRPGIWERLGMAFAVGTGDHEHIAIGVPEPNLSVLGGGVEMSVFDDLRLEPARALDGRVEIVDLEPQHDAVSRRRRVGVDEIGVVFHIPSVQLKQQSAGAPD